MIVRGAVLLMICYFSLSAPLAQASNVPLTQPKKNTRALQAVAPTPALRLSQQVIEPDGVLRIVNGLSCSGTSTDLCVQACGSSQCEWTEPLCRDCFGTGLPVMREIFERLSTSYRPTQELDHLRLVQLLTSRALVLISTRSLYDTYNVSDSVTFTNDLAALCGTKDGFIAVQLDEEQRPVQAVLAICSNASGVKAMLIDRAHGDLSFEVKPIQIQETKP